MKVKARKTADGTLVAKKARVVTLSFSGTLVSLDAAGAVVGWKYLESHPGSPVSCAVTATTSLGEGEEAPVVGQPVRVRARPAEDGSGLVALKLLGGPDS